MGEKTNLQFPIKKLPPPKEKIVVGVYKFRDQTGQYKAAAELYKEVIPRKDKLRNTELATQLDELRTIFEVDKLILKNRKRIRNCKTALFNERAFVFQVDVTA